MFSLYGDTRFLHRLRSAQAVSTSGTAEISPIPGVSCRMAYKLPMAFHISCGQCFTYGPIDSRDSPGKQSWIDPPGWHYFLVYCARAMAICIPNPLRIFKVLPPLLTAGVILIIFTVLFLLITLLARATPKQTRQTIFVDVINEKG